MKKKVLSLILSCLLATSCFVGTVGCSDEPNKPSGNGTSSGTANNPAEDYISQTFEGALHDVTVTDNAARKFVVNNATDYKVVYGGEASLRAATYLAGMVASATDNAMQRMDIIKESDVESVTDGDKYILIGCDKYFAQAGYSIENADLRTSGYCIRTKGNNVYVQANAKEGYHLGALAFLRHVTGYDMISEDTVIFTREPSTIPDMEILERPDFEYRYFTNNLANSELIYGMGFNGSADIFIPLRGKGMHNVFACLPRNEYAADHPLWYFGDSEKSGQLCYTAHGDGKEREAMLKEVYKHVKDSVELYPENYNITLTAEDNKLCCTCEACAKITEKYGSVAATIVPFINELDDMLRADIDAGNVKGRKKGEIIHIWFFAYNATAQAPKLPAGEEMTDEHAKYLRGNRDVGVILAPVYAKYAYTFTDEPNEIYAMQMYEWTDVCQNVMTWIYECNFNAYMYPYNTFDTLIENYRYCFKCKSMIMYNQGIRQNTASPSFVRFREYLASKAQFDLRVNFKDVQKTWFDNYFLDAAPVMLDYYNQIMTWSNHLEQTGLEFDGGIYQYAIDSAEYWPFAMLNNWMDMIDEAYGAIAKYEATDPELYERLVSHIKLESLFPRYVLYKHYGSNYNTQEIFELRKQFKADCDEFGITQDRELSSITGLWTSWGII